MADVEKPDNEAVDTSSKATTSAKSTPKKASPPKKKVAPKKKSAAKKKITVKKAAVAPAAKASPPIPAPAVPEKAAKQEKIRVKAESMGVIPKEKPSAPPVEEATAGGFAGVVALWLPLVIIGVVFAMFSKKPEPASVTMTPPDIQRAVQKPQAVSDAEIKRALSAAATAPATVASEPSPAPKAAPAIQEPPALAPVAVVEKPAAAPPIRMEKEPVAEAPIPVPPSAPVDPFTPFGQKSDATTKTGSFTPPPPPPPPSWDLSPPVPAAPTAVTGPGDARSRMGYIPQTTPVYSARPHAPEYPAPVEESAAVAPEQTPTVPVPEYANPPVPGYRTAPPWGAGPWGPYNYPYRRY